MGVEELRAVLGIIDVQPSAGVGGPNEVRLGDVARHRQTGSAAVLVDTSAANNTLDMIAILERCAQRLQYNGCEALTSSVAVGVGIPHTTPPRRGQHVELTLGNVHALRTRNVSLDRRQEPKTAPDQSHNLPGLRIKLAPAAIAIRDSPLRRVCTA